MEAWAAAVPAEGPSSTQAERVLRPDQPPVLICGCHGGGTSYVTRLLRYQRFFAGADACELTRRKWHESRALSDLNEWILSQLVPGACGSREARSFGMRTVRKDDWETFQRAIADEGRVDEIARALPLREVFQSYWGERGMSGREALARFDGPWGWKDPRNSLTLPIWKRIFPDVRVLVIRKPWFAGRTGHSNSGRWFKEESTPFVRNLYSQPAALDTEIDDHFFLQLPEGISEYSRFDSLIGWMGLPAITLRAYEILLQETRVEWGELLSPSAPVQTGDTAQPS